MAVFPTHVGVFLKRAGLVENVDCLPHARGGVSESLTVWTKKAASSPRTWGCFLCYESFAVLHSVFPTHVGVFLLCSLLARGS